MKQENLKKGKKREKDQVQFFLETCNLMIRVNGSSKSGQSEVLSLMMIEIFRFNFDSQNICI